MAGAIGNLTTSAAGDWFAWNDVTAGDWIDLANWIDITTNQTPAVRLPGALDRVNFFGPTSAPWEISGQGESGTLTTSGNVTVLGALNTGTLVTSLGTLTIGAGATIAAQSASAVGNTLAPDELLVSGTGAALDVSGALSSFSGTIAAESGGTIKVGELILAGTSQVVTVDSLSSIGIGAAGSVAAGTLAIDSGHTLTGAGSVCAHIIDDGLISTAAILTLGNIGLGASGILLQSLAGTGTIEAQSGGSIIVRSNVGTVGPTFQLDGNAALTLETGVAAGNTIALRGNHNVLVLAIDVFGGIPPVAATVNGFNATDTLVLGNMPQTSLAFIPGTGESPGILDVFSGPTLVDAMPLTGDFAGQTFVVGQVSYDRQQVFLIPAPSTTPSAGTSHAASYVWNGPIIGDWNTAADWNDLTDAVSPAIIAPGSLDSVAINGWRGIPIFITGAGNAASVAADGNVTIMGSLNAGSLLAGTTLRGGTLAINSGATLRADAANTAIGDSIVISGPDGLLDIAGTLSSQTYGMALLASQGGVARLGSLHFSSAINVVQVDAASSVEIGTAGGAALGALTIDSGHTLQGSGWLESNVVDNGLIEVLSGSSPASPGTLEVQGSLTGNGTLSVDSNAILQLDDAVADTVAVHIAPGGELILQNPGTQITTPITDLSLGAEIALKVSIGKIIRAVAVTSPGTVTVTTDLTTYRLTNVGFDPGTFQHFSFSPIIATTLSFAVSGIAWTGATGDTAWGAAGNWSANQTPGATDPVFLLDNPGTITGSGTAQAVTIGTPGTASPASWIWNGLGLTLTGQANPSGLPSGIGFYSDAVLNGGTSASANATGSIGGPAGVRVAAQAGASVTTAGDSIGSGSGEFGMLLLSGASTRWTEQSGATVNGVAPGFLRLGSASGSNGAAGIADGATLSTGGLAILGQESGSSGNVQAMTGGVWSAHAGVTIGQSGTGAVTANGGSVIIAGQTTLGSAAGGSGTLLVTGAAGSLNNAGGIVVGAAGFGSLQVSDFGTRQHRLCNSARPEPWRNRDRRGDGLRDSRHRHADGRFGRHRWPLGAEPGHRPDQSRWPRRRAQRRRRRPGRIRWLRCLRHRRGFPVERHRRAGGGQRGCRGPVRHRRGCRRGRARCRRARRRHCRRERCHQHLRNRRRSGHHRFGDHWRRRRGRVVRAHRGRHGDRRRPDDRRGRRRFGQCGYRESIRHHQRRR